MAWSKHTRNVSQGSYPVARAQAQSKSLYQFLRCFNRLYGLTVKHSMGWQTTNGMRMHLPLQCCWTRWSHWLTHSKRTWIVDGVLDHQTQEAQITSSDRKATYLSPTNQTSLQRTCRASPDLGRSSIRAARLSDDDDLHHSIPDFYTREGVSNSFHVLNWIWVAQLLMGQTYGANGDCSEATAQPLLAHLPPWITYSGVGPIWATHAPPPQSPGPPVVQRAI